MLKPVTLPCGHSGCLKCMDELVVTNTWPKCPVCRVGMPGRLNVNICMDQLTRKLAMQCCNTGCSWRGTYGEAERHDTECQKRTVECKNAGCDETMKREEIANHKDTCPKQMVSCPKCAKDVAREVQGGHDSDDCSFSLKECPLGCGERLPRYVLWSSLSPQFQHEFLQGPNL